MVIENDPKQVRYRKMANNMTVSGMAVIAFGVWSVLRAILYFVLHHVDLVKLVRDEIGEVTDIEYTFLNNFIFLLVLGFLVTELIARIYVGRSAAADAAARKKKSPVYIFLTIIMGWLCISGFISQIALTFSDDMTERVIEELEASAIMDAISGFALLELAVSSVAARILRKKLRSEGKMIHTSEDKG